MPRHAMELHIFHREKPKPPKKVEKPVEKPVPERKMVIIEPKAAKPRGEPVPVKSDRKYKRLVAWVCPEHGLQFTDTDQTKGPNKDDIIKVHEGPIVCQFCDSLMAIVFDSDKGEVQENYKWDGVFFYKKGLCAEGVHTIWIPYVNNEWQYDACPEC